MHEMITVSGKRINLLNPDLSLIDIEDIAHHLSLINRYTGATPAPYSVAQHSVYVAEYSKCLGGLLHDAHEAYIGDVILPVKEALGSLVYCEPFEMLDHDWRQYMQRRFSLGSFDVHEADAGIRRDEMRCLKGVDSPVFFVKRIQPWGWRKAKRKFLETYERLNGPR